MSETKKKLSGPDLAEGLALSKSPTAPCYYSSATAEDARPSADR